MSVQALSEVTEEASPLKSLGSATDFLAKKPSGHRGPKKGLQRRDFERLEAFTELPHILLTEDFGGAERPVGALFLEGDVAPPKP